MTTLLLFMAGPAVAQGYPPSPVQTVVAQKVTPPAQAVQGRAPGRVAFTGADILPWVLMALAAVVVGTLLVVAARRRRVEA